MKDLIMSKKTKSNSVDITFRNEDGEVKMDANKLGKILGHVIAFTATSKATARAYCKRLSDELEAKSLGKVLPQMTPTDDGWWVSVDGSNEQISQLAIDLGKTEPGILVACVVPSTKRVVGGEVLGSDMDRSLIRVILGIPEAKQLREVVVDFEVPDPGEHVETESQEYRDYYGVNGPHIQLRLHLDELLRKADLGYVDDWESDDGHPYWIVAKGADEMVLKETILKTLAENDHGLQDIEVFTQTEMDLYWAESDALVAKYWAEWDAKPQEDKDRIEKERQAETAGDVDAMLAAIRKRRDELKEEEYATKMLDGAHARMEQARQMNEQGELK